MKFCWIEPGPHLGLGNLHEEWLLPTELFSSCSETLPRLEAERLKILEDSTKKPRAPHNTSNNAASTSGIRPVRTSSLMVEEACKHGSLSSSDDDDPGPGPAKYEPIVITSTEELSLSVGSDWDQEPVVEVAPSVPSDLAISSPFSQQPDVGPRFSEGGQSPGSVLSDGKTLAGLLVAQSETTYDENMEVDEPSLSPRVYSEPDGPMNTRIKVITGPARKQQKPEQPTYTLKVVKVNVPKLELDPSFWELGGTVDVTPVSGKQLARSLPVSPPPSPIGTPQEQPAQPQGKKSSKNLSLDELLHRKAAANGRQHPTNQDVTTSMANRVFDVSFHENCTTPGRDVGHTPGWLFNWHSSILLNIEAWMWARLMARTAVDRVTHVDASYLQATWWRTEPTESLVLIVQNRYCGLPGSVSSTVSTQLNPDLRTRMEVDPFFAPWFASNWRLQTLKKLDSGDLVLTRDLADKLDLPLDTVTRWITMEMVHNGLLMADVSRAKCKLNLACMNLLHTAENIPKMVSYIQYSPCTTFRRKFLDSIFSIACSSTLVQPFVTTNISFLPFPG